MVKEIGEGSAEIENGSSIWRWSKQLGEETYQVLLLSMLLSCVHIILENPSYTGVMHLKQGITPTNVSVLAQMASLPQTSPISMFTLLVSLSQVEDT